MAKFDLKKYLKEGKLLKSTEQLNESCPGYDDRGFGDPLPTLDSIQRDYELSQSEEDEEMEHEEMGHEEETEEDNTTEILDDVEELGLEINNSTVNIHLNEESKFNLKKYLSEGKIHEITQSGGEGVYPMSEKPGDMFQQKEVEELFPIAFAMKDNKDFKDKLAQHGEWTEQSGYNNTFVHFQYHKMEDVNGNDYFVHQGQHYNHNYDDFRSPRFTVLSITKNYEKDNEEDLGEYIVGTEEYLDDIRNMEAKGINMKRG